MKYIKYLFLIIICVFVFTGCKVNKNTVNKKTIIVTNFPCYDFARAITKDTDIEVKMLLKPGAEIHDFDPTPQDIINIQKSGMFIYVGGESDKWVDDALKNINKDEVKIVKLMDLVELKEEEIVEGMESDEEEDEEETEYDEHIWTSPMNALIITRKLKDEIIKLDENNKDKYESNASDYLAKLTQLDIDIRNVLRNSKRKELIFGDRFPLRYFVDEYNLKYYAAFPGCSGQTEASAKTISYLVDKVKKDKIPFIFHIELSNGKIAETIAKETNTKVLEFHSLHNISQEDFDAGLTYIDLMNKNIENLKEALN